VIYSKWLLSKGELTRSRANRVKQRSGGGTGSRKDLIVTPDPPEIGSYVDRIICGDALNALRSMPGRCVDIVITSPPYNFGHAYAQDIRDDTRELNEYFKTLYEIWPGCYRVLKPGGRMTVNVLPLFSDYIPTHHVIFNQLTTFGFLWKAEILWECTVLKVFLMDLGLKYLERFINSPTKNSDTNAQEYQVGGFNSPGHIAGFIKMENFVFYASLFEKLQDISW
jgi:DNA modification methylase